jgi:coenzyme F420 hydrogenase subunit beta
VEKADLNKIVSNGLCLGCGGCVAALRKRDLQMHMTAEGFLRPTAESPLNPTQQKTLATVCSGLSMTHPPEVKDHYHPLWGPTLRVVTGHAVDPAVRHRGSSGGVISALAIMLVERGEVEFVLSTAADAVDPIGNRTRPLRSRDEVLSAAGSRYSPSSPLEHLESHLAAGKTFAFVGKPCDVATLRRMARVDPRIDKLIPYKIAFFCAGIPSRIGTLGVLEALGVRESEVTRFQYRGDGWPGRARAWRHDGSVESMDYNSSWGEILNRHLQFRCKICPDGTGEFADLVCADAWYGSGGYPEFAERPGRSLILTRTAAGQRLLEAAEHAGVVQSESLDVSEIERMQPYQANRKRMVLARSAALAVARGVRPRFRRLRLLRLGLLASKIEQVRNFIGTFRRARGRVD